MAMRGWRRIGIIVSVIWFFGFGVFLWNKFVEDAVAPYAQDLQICSAIEQYSDDFWQANARNSEELSESCKPVKTSTRSAHQKRNCNGKVSDRQTACSVAVLVIDLVTIASGWLIVGAALLLAVGFIGGLQRPENSGGARG